MIEPYLMLFRRAQTDRANRVVMGAFGEDQHMQAITDQSHGDKPDLSVIEAVILALKGRVSIEPLRGSQRHTVLGDIRGILRGMELDFHVILCTH